MTTPRVIETRLRMEPVARDTFIDDLAPSTVRDAGGEHDRRVSPSRRTAST